MNAIFNQNYSTPPSSPKSTAEEDFQSRQLLDIESITEFNSSNSSITNRNSQQLPSPLSPNSTPTDFFTLTKADTSTIIPNEISELNFLSVDDNQINLTIMNKLLTKTFKNPQLKSTLNPLDVIGELHSKIYHVLFLDIEMPELSGVQIAQMIRSIPFFNQLSIIAVTSRFSEQDVELYKQVGIDYTIPKPMTLDSSEFRSIVLNTLQHRR